MNRRSPVTIVSTVSHIPFVFFVFLFFFHSLNVWNMVFYSSCRLSIGESRVDILMQEWSWHQTTTKYAISVLFFTLRVKFDYSHILPNWIGIRIEDSSHFIIYRYNRNLNAFILQNQPWHCKWQIKSIVKLIFFSFFANNISETATISIKVKQVRIYYVYIISSLPQRYNIQYQPIQSDLSQVFARWWLVKNCANSSS